MHHSWVMILRGCRLGAARRKLPITARMRRVRWQNLRLALLIDTASWTGWGAEAWAWSGKAEMSA